MPALIKFHDTVRWVDKAVVVVDQSESSNKESKLSRSSSVEHSDHFYFPSKKFHSLWRGRLSSFFDYSPSKKDLMSESKI